MPNACFDNDTSERNRSVHISYEDKKDVFFWNETLEGEYQLKSGHWFFMKDKQIGKETSHLWKQKYGQNGNFFIGSDIMVFFKVNPRNRKILSGFVFPLCVA